MSKRLPMPNIVYCLLLGFAIGGISGLLGIGGGVLLVPALMWLFGFRQSEAAGISLAILVLPIGLPAVWKYYTDGHLRVDHLEAAAWIAVAFAAGTYAGAALVGSIPLSALRLGFGLMMVYIAVRFILASDSEAANAGVGLVAVAFAWLGYYGLRLVGRKHLARPDLGEQIRAMKEQGWGENDYYI
jgi:uncharacterized membrane protein YfcA